MLNLLVFILACYGLTMILAYSKLIGIIRPNHAFFKCPMCLGFWVGIIFSFGLTVPFDWFTAGCISSGTSYFLSRLVNDDGIMINSKK